MSALFQPPGIPLTSQLGQACGPQTTNDGAAGLYILGPDIDH